ncbi:hypothetical protein ScPMuIL_001748 [Solemya velum]
MEMRNNFEVDMGFPSTPKGGTSETDEMEKQIEDFVMQRIKAKFQDKIDDVVVFIKSKIQNINVAYNSVEKRLKISGSKDDVHSACVTLESISSDDFMYLFDEEQDGKKIRWLFKDLSFTIKHLKKEIDDLKSAKGKIEIQQNTSIISCDIRHEVQVKLHVLWLCKRITNIKTETEMQSDWSGTATTTSRSKMGASTQSIKKHSVVGNNAESDKNSSRQDVPSQHNEMKKSSHSSVRKLPTPKPTSILYGESAHVSHETSFQDSIDKSLNSTHTQMMSNNVQNSFSQKSQASSRPKRPKTSRKISDFEYDINTKEGLLIRLYTTSITCLRVDAIVNAANGKLQHAGGVALAIAREAGRDMDEQCKDILKKRGNRIAVTENCVTTGGCLPCGHVIHAVGPQWGAYKDKTSCLTDLYKTVNNILKTAEKHRYRTVAIPAISSGIYGVPKNLCARMYMKAALDFSEKHLKHLRELHFVDIQDEILFMIAGAHDDWLQNPKALIPSVAAAEFDQAMNNTKQTNKHSSSTICRELKSKEMYGTTVAMFKFCEKVTVKIYTCDLIKVKYVDAIVSSQDPTLSSKGKLSSAIHQAAGLKFKPQKRSYPYGCVIATSAGKLIPAGRILNAIVRQVSDSPKQSEINDISYIVCSILHMCTKMKICRLAMPLLGTGKLDKKSNAFEKCCKPVYTAIEHFMKNNKPHRLEEVHIVHRDTEVIKTLKSVFKTMSVLTMDPLCLAERGNSRKKGMEEASNDLPVLEIIQSKQGEISHNFGDVFEHVKVDKTTDVDNITNTPTSSQNSDGDMDEDMKNELCVCDQCGDTHDMAEMDVLGCRHVFCNKCAVPMQNNKICIICSNMAESRKSTKPTQDSKPVEICVICMDEIMNPVRLKTCGHVFCDMCIRNAFQHKPVCPVCNMVCGSVHGNQPVDGEMKLMKDKIPLPGYPKCGTLVINYTFPSGRQKEYHPNPGSPYKAIDRTAFLPDNSEGNRVLRMLKVAFQRRLTFTIGMSRTSGKENAITWNDIHHKTRRDGGPQRFGYPDPSYLQRVREELAAKGITEADI